MGSWYLVSNDVPFAGGQRLPPEGPCAVIQPQLLQFVWHWKHRRAGSCTDLSLTRAACASAAAMVW